MGLKKKVVRMIALLVFVVLAIWTVWGNTALELNIHTISSPTLPKAFHGFRIAQISDLHNAELGDQNEKLLAMLKAASPDIIAMTGDLIDSRRTDMDIALNFAAEAVKIAPCYYVTGNHEGRIAEYSRLRDGLEAVGVTVLDDQRLELTRSGQTITLIGVNDPSFHADAASDDAAIMQATLQTLAKPEDTYTILLSHRPELLDVYAAADIDLVLSGHAHGGQIRLPLIGGLIAPNQGLFPKYDAGLYCRGTTNQFVSRGIGNSLFPLRFNNRPEVVLIVLKGA